MYNIDDTYNIRSMRHSIKEQLTWQFWNKAAYECTNTFELSPKLSYLRDPRESQTYMDDCADWG